MARKESITKDMLLEVAFELVKEEGIDNLTARKLAAKAGCSTQPIFRTYKNMEEVAEDVFDKANEYERIKEKLIGETFEYAPKFDYIINGLLMRYEKDADLIRFLRENTGLIISTFNKSGTRNLRILKHALNDFKKIFEMVNKYYPNTNNRVMQTMLIFTIAVSFEIKSGKITNEQYQQFIEALYATSNTYDINMEIKILDKNVLFNPNLHKHISGGETPPLQSYTIIRTINNKLSGI